MVVPNSTKRFNDNCPPLNLAHIASYLRLKHPEVEVRLLDGMISDVYPLIEKYKPDVLGLTAVTPQAPEAYRLADWIRENRYAKLVVMGGVHASVLPMEALEHVDVVVRGFGELAFCSIIEAFGNGKEIPKVIQGTLPERLDDLPSPDFKLVNLRNYLQHGPPFPGLDYPIMSLVTARGCPFRCPFCHNSSRTYKVSYFSAERVVSEILYVHNRFGVTSFFFNDDEFLFNVKRLKELAVLFKKHGIDKWIKWGCQARVKTLTVPVLKLAKRMGCKIISPGFESGNPRSLKYLKCGTTTLEDNARAIRLAKEVGIMLGGSFIYGLPDETLAEMKMTFQWILDHEGLVTIGTNTLIPYPGTEVWELCMKLGLLPEKVDYERLVPTYLPHKTYIVNRVVPPKAFIQFMITTSRMGRIITYARFKGLRGFLSWCRKPVWWWAWLKHPRMMIKILVACASKTAVH